ncbi:MAG: helix-turn-helix transcriptional regulator [Alphaproteobacteria bacterium]|nr:helix-turn-helix transcriptional regulator [Alphaproteobacteria bacterium]
MTTENPSLKFGGYIAEARKKKRLSQKELAALILREEDQKPISPQYLNDIEHDRRSPTSDALIEQFAKVLDIDPDHLHYLAGKLPADIRQKGLSETEVRQVFTAFRKTTNRT